MAANNVPRQTTSFHHIVIDDDTILKATANLKSSVSAGDRRNVNNYRGISALCAIAKLFELVVLDPFFSYCNFYFSNEQHGFMPKRSTTTNLLTFTSSVQDSFTKGSQTDVIYTDLTAAFDKVNHKIAIAKLDRIGICGSLLEWLPGRTETYCTFSYESRCRLIDIDTLQARRTATWASIVADLLSSRTDCSALHSNSAYDPEA
ncbi:uncharacterized protein LOC129752075 [Uranotaenia lowii]|uniref:uncharacterized protein LOC129752075 n=1 Tax=Uranotaenia lowii TaxID=190385 RepID=UPI0024791484|nr:uncharacterized protein LOC129752075 [Uranotaenia lowii]